MEPCDECCSFVIFVGRASVSESSADLDDLFNLFDVRVATVDVVTHSSDGGQEGLVGSGVVSERDRVPGTAEWRGCLNGGIRTWNCWRGWYVFLVRVVEVFRGGFVWVREPDSGDICGPVFTDLEELGDALLDSGVLLWRAY